MSAFGDLKYPEDFPHFNYVNPNAPKGGVFSQIGPNRQFNQSFQTFNSLNSYILKGDAAHQAMNLKSEAQEMLGEIASVLSCNASDQGSLHLLIPPVSLQQLYVPATVSMSRGSA